MVSAALQTGCGVLVGNAEALTSGLQALNQLPARRFDVAPLGQADRGYHSLSLEFLLKKVNPIQIRPAEIATVVLVQGDDVELCIPATQQSGEGVGVLRGVVAAAHEQVLDHEVPVRSLARMAKGGEDVGEWVAPVRGNQAASLVFERGVERQSHGHVALREELIELRQESDGADRQLVGTQVGTVIVRENANARKHVVEVVERFSHTHVHQVRDAWRAGGRQVRPLRVSAPLPLGDDVLAHDFRCIQVAAEAHAAGLAEGARLPASDLGGDAEGEAVALRNQHAFDEGAIVQAGNELDGAVVLAHGKGVEGVGHGQIRMGGENGPEALAQALANLAEILRPVELPKNVRGPGWGIVHFGEVGEKLDQRLAIQRKYVLSFHPSAPLPKTNHTHV